MLRLHIISLGLNFSSRRPSAVINVCFKTLSNWTLGHILSQSVFNDDISAKYRTLTLRWKDEQ